jgi:hypothetical protein
MSSVDSVAEGSPDVYAIRLSNVACRSVPVLVLVEGLRWLLAVDETLADDRDTEEWEENDSADMGGDKGGAKFEVGSSLACVLSNFIRRRF